MTFAEAVVDLDAVRHNVGVLRRRSGPAEVMAVVKADGYGHGLLPTARAALAGGAGWLGVAQLPEALALREAGVRAPLLSWLHVPGDDFAAALTADVDLSVAHPWALDAVLSAAAVTGRQARVHLKIDTGLARNGCPSDQWPDLLRRVAAAQAEGAVQVVGIWSHYAYADAPEHPTVRAQQAAFRDALAQAARFGVRPELRHLANSAATLTNPASAYDLVRPGLAVYGLSPVPELAAPEQLGLVPAMTLRSWLSLVKPVAAGQGVSYAHAYVTTARTVLGLVPLGYADGLPRHASGTGPVTVRTAGGPVRTTVAGRVCMDQVVLDLGAGAAGGRNAREGDEVVVFGPGAAGGHPDEPTAQDWADAAGTISYEIVSRLGSRVPRRYVGTAGERSAKEVSWATGG